MIWLFAFLFLLEDMPGAAFFCCVLGVLYNH